MNKTVERRLKTLEAKVKAIESACQCILMDIEDVENVEDMFVIEHNFDMIRRNADEAVDYVRTTEDEFDGE